MTSSSTKPEKRFTNFFAHRDNQFEDIPWLRPADFKTLSLKRPIVLVNGAFDLLHRTHMRILFAAAHKGGTVVCALDSDAKVRREKGPTRPILDWIERATTLNYMPIDVIVEIDTRKDMDELMRTLKPNLRVQGGDYQGKPSRYRTRKMFVREGTLRTSTIIERICETHDPSKTTTPL